MEINGFHVTSGHPIYVPVPSDVVLEQPTNLPTAHSGVYGKPNPSIEQWVHPWEVITPSHQLVHELYHFELSYPSDGPDRQHQAHTLMVNGTVCAALGCDTGERLRALYPEDDARYGQVNKFQMQCRFRKSCLECVWVMNTL